MEDVEEVTAELGMTPLTWAANTSLATNRKHEQHEHEHDRDRDRDRERRVWFVESLRSGFGNLARVWFERGYLVTSHEPRKSAESRIRAREKR